jgi:hypothetical protein
MGLKERINGITGNLFQLGFGGPQLKNNAGVIEARDPTDSSLVAMRVASPIGNDDATSKSYVIGMLPFLPNARAVALTNISVSSPDWTVANWDGVTVAVGERVLLTQQTTASENGIYTRPVSGALTRTTDVITCGIHIYIEQGEIYAGCSFVQETTGVISIGSSPIAFACLDGPRLAAPLTTLTASGSGSWVTLLTIPGPASDGYDIVLVVDNVATKSDGTLISRSRGPTTYRRASGILTLSDDSRYLTAATILQQVVSGSNILLQGWQQATGSGNYSFRIRSWFEYVRAI